MSRRTEQQGCQLPNAQQVAARALVLGAVAYRGWLELQASDKEAKASQSGLLEWLQDSRLNAALEPTEREFLRCRLGRADPEQAAAGTWRMEGAAVLAWALEHFDLPPYDQGVDFNDLARALGVMNEEATDELLRAAALRPSDHIDKYARQITVVSWRLRQFGLQPERMDFVGYLREHPKFNQQWLEPLRIIDGDLAIGKRSIARAKPNDVGDCTSIVLERHIAAYWLQGDAVLYSEVDPATILMAC
jgi:hypothetical protein